MADSTLECPHCGQHLQVPEELLGQTVDCPSCKGQISLPKPVPTSVAVHSQRPPLQASPPAPRPPVSPKKTTSALVIVAIILFVWATLASGWTGLSEIGLVLLGGNPISLVSAVPMLALGIASGLAAVGMILRKRWASVLTMVLLHLWTVMCGIMILAMHAFMSARASMGKTTYNPGTDLLFPACIMICFAGFFLFLAIMFTRSEKIKRHFAILKP
ncbi:MAG: hypothetical protein E4H02_08870 [Lentisphaerales bacterium]|nr:MAG: hypothetical protein E4H02_08870 [Lentisphaerales bacterium]